MGLAESSAAALWMPLRTVACICVLSPGVGGRLFSHGQVAVSEAITYCMCAFGMSYLIPRFPFGMLSRAAPLPLCRRGPEASPRGAGAGARPARVRTGTTPVVSTGLACGR